ncbi:acyl-CoA dehydrogenase [Kitasatospora sp. NPDC088548]|uniref:acyl-CoA dehydrogenase n=1 Tax=Kitasatospora sp. NPDC088548 TaxID=3364075 RepID=UPI0038148D56
MTHTYDPDLVKLIGTATQASGGVPYEALLRITAALPSNTPLLADHDRLRSLLELTAMADPRLFHVMFLHHCMTIGPALVCGATPEDITTLTTARAVGAALITEIGRGSSIAHTRTRARWEPSTRTFVLHTPDAAAAKFPVNVAQDGVERLAVVSARLDMAGTDRGTFFFLVPLRDETGPCGGIAIRPLSPTALLPLDYATVRFDNVRVPDERWLADGATITADGSFHDPLGSADERTRRSLTVGRFAWGAVTAGLAAAARAAVAIALPHAARRQTVDRWHIRRPALDHLHQQRLLFGAAARAKAATALARQATHPSWHIPPDSGSSAPGATPSVIRGLGLAKVTVDRLSDSAVDRCRETAGALGFFSENRLIDYQALTMAFRSAGGDNHLILLDAAWSMVREVEYEPPAELSGPEPPDLENPRTLTHLFRRREGQLHAELAQQLAAATAAGLTPDEAWNNLSSHAEQLALAHSTRILSEALHSCPDAGEPLVQDLYQLLRLEHIAADLAWYLVEGYLTPSHARALPELIDRLCRRLHDQAPQVVDVMSVPTELIRAPLGDPDYVASMVGAWTS